jgi:hypothetical protein
MAHDAFGLCALRGLRNNLFHGVKWAYGIRDQRSNFEHANQALMAAIACVLANGAYPSIERTSSGNLEAAAHVER